MTQDDCPTESSPLKNKSLSFNSTDLSGSDNSGTSRPVIYHESQGQCHARVGPMCSGKTTWLNGQLTKAADTGWKVLRVSYKQDIRETAGVDHKNRVTSHSSQFKQISDLVDNMVVDRLGEVQPEDYHFIGIDEAQFYDEELISLVHHWVRDMGKIVYISALDVDSDGNLFGHTSKLIGICSTYQKLTAYCRFCREGGSHITSAVITACLIGKTQQKQVGGQETYVSTCLAHHTEHNIPTKLGD